MIALAPAPRVDVRPVPWHRLTWVVWRRYRPTLLGIAGVVAVLSAYLVFTGHRMRVAYDAVAACQPPAHSTGCQYQWMNFTDTYGDPGFVGPLLLLLPGIIGVFVGAPLLGRELETGLFRYSWTQGVGRMRWAAALIVPAVIGVAAIMVGVGLLESWHNQPLFDSGIRHRLDPSIFPLTGPAVAGWTLVAFTGGVLAGLLWRRVVPALASGFAAWFGLAYLASALRLRYPAPLTTTSLQLHDRDLSIDQWWTKGGTRVSEAQINTTLESLGVHLNTEGNFQGTSGTRGTDPVQYLLEHGYTQVTTYQPDTRYWTFQWIEFGWLLALSAAVLGIALWWLRRRSA